MRKLNMIIVVGFIVFVCIWAVTFTVDERERALKVRLGDIIRSDYKPGLHFMIPFYHKVVKLDSRIQTLDEAAEEYLTVEKKNVDVDSFVKWKIGDVEKFYKANNNGDFDSAGSALSNLIKNGLRNAIGRRTVNEAVSGERKDIMRDVANHANREAKNLGIDVLDVRIKRVDFPTDISGEVFRRMESERERIANELRSQGEEEAEKIRAEADRQRTVLLAEATKKSEELRGQGDAEATDIYAKAYSADQMFYDFYRSMQAYRESFKHDNNTMVLSPDSEFFNHFGSKAPN